MNVHSLFDHFMGTLKQSRQTDRRSQILDAAESCFVRAGFHRTTMQDVANEVGMAPGNLYRYFPSKDAMIAGLAERDRVMIAADFAALSNAPDVMAAFEGLGKKHFVEQSREKAIISLEIWAESSRNQSIAAFCAMIQQEVQNGIIAVCLKGKETGFVHPDVDVRMVSRLIMTISDGLIRRKAVDPDFDGNYEVDTILSLIGAMLSGAILLAPCGSTSALFRFRD